MNSTPHECTDCGGRRGERVDTQRHDTVVVDVYACNDCYAGWEVVYTFAEKNQTVEPEQ